MRNSQRFSSWQGAAAGALAGVAGALAMNALNRVLDEAEGGARNEHDRALSHRGSRPDVFEAKEQARRGRQAVEATEEVAQKAAASAGQIFINHRDRQRGALAVHLLFGAAAGALYGSLVPRRNPAVGMGYGAAVWAASVPLLLPALGLAKPVQEYPSAYHAKSVAAHLVYGAVTDAVLRMVDQAA